MSLLTHAQRTPTALLDHARRLAADPLGWPGQPRFTADRRWYLRLGGDAHREAWLLTWLPGQGTDWHDHGGSAGAFQVISGRLREDTLGGSRHLATGDGRPFGARHVHRITNDAASPAVSLHVYAPALTSMTRYDLVGGALRVRSVEQAGSDW
jgi:quercetin dioxygenase-like cupin family protein